MRPPFADGLRVNKVLARARTTKAANPPRLALRIAAYTAVALLFSSGATLWFVHRNTTSQAEKETGARAAFVAKVLLEEQNLRESDFQRVVGSTRQRQLDALFKRAGTLDGFLRASLVSRTGLVTYSSYHGLMGRPLATSGAYREALGGKGVHTVGRLRDSFGIENGIKVLRSDLPIRSEGHAHAFGVIELAQDYRVVSRRANETLLPVAGFLFLALIVVYLSLMPILRRVTAAVEERNRRLVEQAATLERSLAAAQEARGEAEAARRAFAEQNKRLRELDRLKDEFLSLVSHELRTPLTSIRGYLDLVLDEEAGEVNPEQRRFLEAVERNSGRLLRLVGDLLFVAQADAGRLTLEQEQLDVGLIAAHCVEAASPAADEKKIELRLSTAPVPPLVGDRGRLAQVLDNLVSNALKFTPEGGSVEVRTYSDDAHVSVEVSDTGIGIPVADQPRLFERFFRSSIATDRAIPGTGLGLAIVKAIVEAHGGQISVESKEGNGTTFRLELPLTAESQPVEPAEEAA